MKYTPSQYKFLKEAQAYLREFLESGKVQGKVPLDAKLYLIVDQEEEQLGSVYQLLSENSRNHRPVYIVRIPPEGIGDWDTIRHEAGHIESGHPSKGLQSSILVKQGDFHGFIERELEAEVRSRHAICDMQNLPDDLEGLVYICHNEFGLSHKDAYYAIREVAMKHNIPHKYLKDTRKRLDW